jgi:hypothetical protein
VIEMTELATILCIVFAAVALTCVGFCLFRAFRARRDGNSRWGCCCGTGGAGGVNGR